MICGIDEAGRGCAAGPMVIAGVILTKEINGLTDSKKLSKKKREELYPEILENSLYKIYIASNTEIDSIGISHVMKNALTEIKEYFKEQSPEFIFDGKTSYKIEDIKTIIKADLTVQEVSAASILAKVTKDRILDELNKDYPLYDFKSHSGYLTKKHLDEIREHGLSPIHRHSYKIKL